MRGNEMFRERVNTSSRETMGPFLVMEKKMVQGPIFGKNKFASASSQKLIITTESLQATEQRQERMH